MLQYKNNININKYVFTGGVLFFFVVITYTIDYTLYYTVLQTGYQPVWLPILLVVS